jgi:hypothetical protein
MGILLQVPTDQCRMVDSRCGQSGVGRADQLLVVVTEGHHSSQILLDVLAATREFFGNDNSSG